MSANETILIPPQAGIAPLDPNQQPNERAIQEQERSADCPELLQYLKRTCDTLRAHRAAEWTLITNQAATCMAFLDDRQYGTAKEGVFVDAKREPGDVRPLDNWYKIHIEKLMTEFVRASPDIQVRATDKNNAEKVEAAKFAQARVNANRKRQLRASDRQREYQSLLMKAITYRYIYHKDESDDAPIHRKPRRVKKQYGQTRSIIACKLCGSPMKPVTVNMPDSQATAQAEEPEAAQGSDYRCIHCGSNRQKTIEIGSREVEVVEGYDEVKGGSVETRHIDPLMVRMSLKARRSVSDSSWLWYKQTIERHILENAYRDLKIKSVGQGGTSDNNTDQLRRDAEGAPSNALATGPMDQGAEYDSPGGDQFEECPYDLFWIDLSVYKNKKFPTPQRLRGGRTIPANQRLGEIFPDGMCIVMNADQVLDMYPENKNKKWLFCVYGIREHALHGSGTNSLIGPQITRNDLKSYLLANTYYNAAAREFIRDGAFTGNRLPALNEAAIVKDVPDDKAMVGWAYDKAQGSPLPEQTVALYQAEGGSMQEGAGTSSLSNEGAAADVKALGTATGVAAMRGMAVDRMGPNLMLLTEMEVDWCYIVLEHELEYFPPERFLSMANRAITAQETDGTVTYGMDGIRAFLKCNPRVDFEIEAVQGSWMPQSDLDRKASFGGFMQVVTELAKALPNHPLTQELIAMAADRYGITDLDFNGWTSTEQVAQARIRAFAKTISVMLKHRVNLPLEALIQEVLDQTPEAAIDNEMDNHPIFLQFYENWWASDEGRTAPPLLKHVIHVQHVLHRAGIVYKAQNIAKDELAGEAPKAEAAAAMAAATAPKDDPPKESLSYKDAPPAIRRQMEAAAGYEPATEDDGGEGAETAAEAAKVQGQLAVQEHKAQLEADADARKTELAITEATAEAQLEEQRAEGDHSRAMELEHTRQDHQTGIEGAKLMHKSAETAVQQQHERTEKDKDRQTQKEKPKQ